MKAKLIFLVAALICTATGIARGEADSTAIRDLPWPRLKVDVGGLLSTLDSEVRIGAEQLGVGLNISLEDALGFESSSLILRGGMIYCFGRSKRHGAGLNFISFRRESSRILQSDIDVGDTTLTIGTEISSILNVDIIKGTYSYSLLQDDRFKIDASFGVFVMPLKFSIRGGNQEAESADFVAPLPAFGLRSDFALTKRLFLSQAVEVFYFKIKNFKSRLSELRMSLEYNAWEHLGFGAGVTTFRLNVEALGEDYPMIDFKGNIGFGYTGLFLFGKYYLM